MLIKKGLREPLSIKYNLPSEPEEHHPEGRLIILEFPSFTVMNTYVPNHGWIDTSFER